MSKAGRNRAKCQNYLANGKREANKARRAEKQAMKLAKRKEKLAAKQANEIRFAAIWGHKKQPV